MKTNKIKTIFNIDRIKVCLKQPESLYDYLYEKYHKDKSKCITYNGFYLSFPEKEKVNDKDITAVLYLLDMPIVKLGEFVFNKSEKYGTKCFFTYSTKSLYDIAGVTTQGKGAKIPFNYFAFPFEAFRQLGLTFNNVSSLEIACDTEGNAIRKIQYAVGKPIAFDMILLWKKVKSETELLDGFYEYYQRTRAKKATSPTLYIHNSRAERGDRCELKIYDKARELAQVRNDKEPLVRAWNDMGNNIQRLEISVERKQFRKYFKKACADNNNKWIDHAISDKTAQERAAIEEFFFELGLSESLRKDMFLYFADHLLHFKLKDHNKTPLSVCELAVLPESALKREVQRKTKRVSKRDTK